MEISNWLKLNETRIQNNINELKIYEVKEPDTGKIKLKEIIYLLEASREEIYQLINKIEIKNKQIELLENRIEKM